jgi:hypothetical protein
LQFGEFLFGQLLLPPPVFGAFILWYLLGKA